MRIFAVLIFTGVLTLSALSHRMTTEPLSDPALPTLDVHSVGR